ncbi:hypothetical protein MPSEU_000532200 [Mayamaea pseudoterrestris]|nr:hypothetical protein MPSEU_000532200 [Mayamaea pseudoterrestris]
MTSSTTRSYANSMEYVNESEYDALTDSSSRSTSPAFSVSDRLERRRQKRTNVLLIGVVSLVGMLLVLQYSTVVTSETSTTITSPKLSPSPEQEPLSSFIHPTNGTVYANDHVRKLIDFAIVGNAKCGTTFLQQRLGRNPDISMYKHELRYLQHRDVAGMAQAMYDLDHTKLRGFKCPNDLGRRVSLDALRTYWPDTKLIVGVRHPVSHFESWYNYFTRKNRTLAPAIQMTNNLPDFSMFHGRLSMLGKTNTRDPDEATLLNHYRDQQLPRMPNPVFLYEITQMFDPQFQNDFSEYLGLKTPFRTEDEPPQFSYRRRMKRYFKGKKAKPTRVSPNYNFAIDVCEDQYIELRKNLMENGGRAAKWIKDYFLKASDVTVSNQTHFLTLLDTWTIDPCIKRKAIAAKASSKRQ